MKSNLKKILEYTAVFQKAREGGYTVTVPALPGCISEGDDFEDAQKNIREAIELYLEIAAESQININIVQAGEIFSAPIKVKV